jgi:hypothetical protein
MSDDPHVLQSIYLAHYDAMTSEGLHDKGDIATELAWRDAEIERLHTENKTLFNLKLLQEEQFRYDIEHMRDAEIERLTKEIEVQGRNVKALVKIAITKDHQIEQLDAKIERLSHAVRLAASQKLPDEMNAREFADWQHGYEALVKLARAALAKEDKP